jgi:2-polyprenyl-3-methyl-5-hydroxy-6-metoxy-1,4-benzoquinol methylase
VSYDGEGRFSLPDEHAIPLTDETSPACVIGAFETALGSVYATDAIAERFRTGDGFAWGAHHEHVLGGCERFFRPGYLNNLASAWIPALDGVEAKLAAGARVADVGCGHGASTLLMAEAYPASTVVGFDAHGGSIEAARKRAADAGLAGRVEFEVATATSFSGTYDLVCFFDCLHDMGDPAGACAHVRAHLAPGGTMMLIEPFAGDDLLENMNPVGATYYAFSTLLCTPSSLSQDVGAALGAQAGEARLREVVTGAGFKSLRRVAETPFNLVLEAKA